ncbi:adenylate/guanylate cyclase domain-containing protein [Labrys okinawensis]|uniref:Adenylate/guanylate cyclase domain-containing protein n=1 Tax=Labrys okinawensis TaxID=346911 RepID=A0A2S9QJQ0_9HYPH|nr:adenylate/guanylate cyclase domain-containing protein [Labrys okinawensis]PRH89571.1 adenylate/guanylate cyclase domain-containing protein [Labrys okinawensis]
MACAGCGLELASGFAFCPHCGRAQPTPCAKCGFACAPGFAFCPRCGTARPPGLPAAEPDAASLVDGVASAGTPDRPEADRRQVTVLFADVSSFTALSERLDPEDVRAFQNALFETLANVVAHYQGFVEKFVGDAVLAVFGAPLAHEDDPERALGAALDMTVEANRLDEHWAGRLGQPVSLHIGIHTGLVVAGHLGRAAGASYAVTGDTVNTTARLLAAASGAILVSEATQALTRHRFAFEPVPDLTLRGKAAPVAAYRLVGRLAMPASGRGLAAHGLESRMVGRDEELARLVALFERAQTGSAQVVDLVGEAGAGKSRLIAEFLGMLETQGKLAGGAVRQAVCSSLGEPAYGLFAALFREAYRVHRDDTLETASRKLAAGLVALGAEADVADAVAPVLNYMLGVEGVPSGDLAPEQVKRQIALAARMLIARRLDQGHLLIVVEDLHWADMASVDLLCDVADHLADRRLMIVLSHRPGGPSLRLARASQSSLHLAPLSADETRTFLGSLFGEADGDALADIQAFVTRRAGGNPLFVEEIVRSLVARGILKKEGSRWTFTAPLDAEDVPPTLQGLLLSRVDGLAVAERRVLYAAAVLGMAFEQDLLTQIAAEPAAVDAALRRLAEAGFLCRVGEGGSHRFAHALVHEAVYHNLLLSRRTELHERAGRALEHAVGSRPERLSDLEALGHHWSLSFDKARGAHYLMAAGDRARAVYANEDAIRHYERALRTLADCPGGESDIRSTRERLADLLALTERRTEAAVHYEAVCEALEAAGDRAGAARLQRKIGGLHWEAGDREGARACFMRGLALLGEEGYLPERAQLYQEVGRLAFRAGDNDGAIAWAERALAEADRDTKADPEPDHMRDLAAIRAQAYNTMGVALARTGRSAVAVEQIERSVRLAEDHHLLQAACRGYTNLGVLYSTLDPERSIATCLRGLETAKKVGDLGFQSRIYANLAVAYCALTDRCEAEGVKAAQMAVDLDRRLGLLDHLAAPLIILGQIYQCRGEHALAFASYEEALRLAEQMGEPQFLFPCYDGLGTLHLDAGNQDQAALYLAKSEEVCQRAGLEPDALMVLPFLC